MFILKVVGGAAEYTKGMKGLEEAVRAFFLISAATENL
jgi:hypothetical protein